MEVHYTTNVVHYHCIILTGFAILGRVSFISSGHKILFVLRFFFRRFQFVLPLLSFFQPCVNIAHSESSNQKRL